MMFRHREYLIFTILMALILMPLEPAVSTGSGLDELLVRAKWRAGEAARYEFSETVLVYENGVLTDESHHTTHVFVDVAAVRAAEGFVLLWKISGSDAPLFGDPVLDHFMYGILADGIVIHTDMFGGYKYISNFDALFGHLKAGVQTLDERGHWKGKEMEREYIEAYLSEPELFEELLIRDMRFMFGLHGVRVFVDEVFTYETWQQNPWGEAAPSKGTLKMVEYDPATTLLTISNEVESLDDGPDMPRLTERQLHRIFLDSGWVKSAELRDDIHYGPLIRNRTVIIRNLGR